MTLSFEEFHAMLTSSGVIDCSCHLNAPCGGCDEAGERYNEYIESGETS